MDNKENITQEDILSLIDDLEKVSSHEDSFTISANSLDTITLSDQYDWGSLSIQPLTTAQLAPLMPSSIGITAGTAGHNLAWNTTSNRIYSYGDSSTITPSLSVKGKADFEDDITIKGKSLSKILDGIEQRLALLHPNEQLENKWEELKELGDRYRELEAEIIARQAMFNTLKN
jgi:hypothetical protein